MQSKSPEVAIAQPWWNVFEPLFETELGTCVSGWGPLYLWIQQTHEWGGYCWSVFHVL